MAQFLDLPSEIRQIIYDALLVDPIREGSRLVCTMDASGESSWSRTTGHLLTKHKPTTNQKLIPTRSSVSHTDYSDLWSLASANKFLYMEATPTMYMHAQLEYTHGDTSSTRKNPTFLHTCLEKITPTTSALYHNLTISYGREYLSAKDMKVVVDLINLRLPNLLSLSIQALDPAIEAWPKMRMRSLLEDIQKTLAAARPVARLTSRPVISIKSRARLSIEIHSFRAFRCVQHLSRFKWSRLLKITRSIAGIRHWRREAQDYHAIACQRGDYLLLTSSLRSDLAGAAEKDAMEIFDDVEDGLAKHQEVLSLINEHETLRIQETELLRKLNL
jgi:hypothetical protein